MDPGTTARAVADDLGEDVELSGREDSYEFINNNSKRGHSNSSWKSGKIVGVDGVLYKENKKTGRMEKQGGKRKKSRRKRRRKRRKSRRGGKWCKCEDLEKICEGPIDYNAFQSSSSSSGAGAGAACGKIRRAAAQG